MDEFEQANLLAGMAVLTEKLQEIIPREIKSIELEKERLIINFTSSTKKDDEELLGCQRMYCLVDGCGEVDESNSAYCIKHGRSLHGMCGSKYKIGTGYCKHCRKSTKNEVNSQNKQGTTKLRKELSIVTPSEPKSPPDNPDCNIHTEIKKEMEKDYSYAEDCIKCTTSELDEGIRKCSFQEQGEQA